MAQSTRPPRLMVSEEGSFAEYTILHRKPQIISDVIAHNDYPREIVADLRAYEREIASDVVQPLPTDAAEAEFWNAEWARWQGRTWRELGWYFAETYFYRRLLQAVRYFQPGPCFHHDPFQAQKDEVLNQGLGSLRELYDAVAGVTDLRERLDFWLLHSLWGNRTDLSNQQARAGARGLEGQSARDLLLIDHREQLWDLFAGRVRSLHWIADNSGLELLSDLALIELLLSNDLVSSVHMHLKPQPFFVSDIMPKDLERTLVALDQVGDAFFGRLAQALRQAREDGRLSISAHPFWATCLFFTQFPDDLRETLAQADLLVLKGDVNYRRLLEDRHWPPETDLASITRYMPAPFVALRTLKGELIVGLPPGKAAALGREDPDWLINGKRGLIHLVNR